MAEFSAVKNGSPTGARMMNMIAETCHTCGAKLFGNTKSCSACMLESGLTSLEDEGLQVPDADAKATTVTTTEFGDFKIEHREDGSLWELGHGGMGVTYLARDNILHRKVALKIIQVPAAARTASHPMRERFLREARSAAALRHPNMAAVYQFGASPDDTHYYYAMELVEGETLEARVRRDGALDTKLVLHIAMQITRALSAAAAEGLIHRDLKPANIMLTRRNAETSQLAVKIIDFGLAKPIAGDGENMDLTQGQFAGTPNFASPEQFGGGPVDIRSDIYSLGATLWFALTGRLPFIGRSIEQIRSAQQFDALPIEQLTQSRVPNPVRSLLQSMLALDRADRPDLDKLAARLRRCYTAVGPENNLPAQLSSFIGRELQVAEIKKLLTSSRLITLTGTGGCGKTRLALRIARDLLSQYPDGVWFVDLAPASDPAMVTQIAADVFGVREQPRRSLIETLSEFLGSRCLLLVLDNCEHLLDACGRLGDALLKTCPNLQILATSREQIGIAGETVSHVPSLAIAEPGPTISLQTLSQFEAVQLFTDRAVAVQPRFALTEMTAPAVAKICWRLDGMPLALELAAARMSALSAAQIAERLQESFKLLSRGKRTATPRHQTLQATIDWSYKLLTDAERILFRQLSVFAGGFDLEAAENVCSGDGIGRDEVLDLLTQLVEKSLVLISEQPNATRYRLLEPIRQYAQDHLRKSGSFRIAQRCHFRHYLRLAEHAALRILGPSQLEMLDELEREHANIVAALTSTVQYDPESALKLSNALGWFWELRSFLAEGREWFKRAMARTPVKLAGLRGEAYVRAGRLACWQGEYNDAISLTREGLRLSEEAGNQRWIGMALNHLGAVAGYIGELDRAETLLEQSLVKGKESGDGDVIWRSLGDLSDVAKCRGEYERARHLLEAFLRQFSDTHGVNLDRPYEARRQDRQLHGEIESALGNSEQATSYFEQAISIARQLGHKRAVVGALDGLGKSAFDRNDFAEARLCYEEALRVAKELGQKSDYATTVRNSLADLAVEERKFDEASRLCISTLRNGREAGDKDSVLVALHTCAWLQFASAKNAESAARLFGAVERIRETLGIAVTPRQRDRHNRRINAIRNALDPEAFAAAWAHGRPMNIEEAVAFALSNLSDAEPV